jgi:hypothetical protein
VNVWIGSLLALCAVTLLALLRRVELLNGGAWWRVLVPSWRFFDAEDATFVLEVRTLSAAGAATPFVPAIPPAPRGPLALLFAPEHNLRLACHDLIERWVLELSEAGPLDESEVERLPSYALVQSAVGYFLRASQPQAGAHFQLRLRDLAPDGTDHEDDLVFLSSEHPLD